MFLQLIRLVAGLHETVGRAREIVVGVGEIGAAVLGELRIQFVLALVDSPTGATEIHGAAGHLRTRVEEAHVERAAATVAAVERRAGNAGGIFEVQIGVGVFAVEVHAAHAHVVIERAVHLHIDIVRVGAGGGRARDRLQHRDGIRKQSGHNPRGGARHLRVAIAGRGGRHAHAPAMPLEVIVLRDGQGKLRRRRPLVVGLERDALLLAVIDIVPRLVVEDGGRTVEQAGAIKDRLKAAHGIFRVEHVDGGAEIAIAAENAEHLLVGDIENWVRTVVRTPRRLFEDIRCHAHAEIVGRAAVFLHTEGRAGLEIDRTAEGIGTFVGGLALDQLHALEHCAGDRLEFEAAVRAQRRERAAVDGHVVERGVHAADVEPIGESFISRTAGDAREPHDDFTRAHVRKVTESIHGDHVLHVVRIPLFRNHRGIALTLAGDLERLEFVDAGRQVEVAHSALTRAHVDHLADSIEADVGDD